MRNYSEKSIRIGFYSKTFEILDRALFILPIKLTILGIVRVDNLVR